MNVDYEEDEVKNNNKNNVNLKESILDHIACLNNIYFKSQQIGEPELDFNEKRAIVQNILNRSHSTFLSRFGNYLLPEHLLYFENASDSNTYEIQYYVKKLKKCQCKPVSKVQIKNRRFEAMKRLMSDGEYFSVGEMRKRNPLLFDQLLGNFLKNPRTKINNEEHSIAHILLEQIDQDHIAALKQSQIEAEMKQIEEFSTSDEDFGVECSDSLQVQKEDANVSSKFTLWGKSYNNNHVIGKKRWKNKQANAKMKPLKDKNDLTQEEKVLLINEFTSFMFSNFLQGKDEFNYSEIDNNPEYDDVNQCDVDEEEKYFDSESPKEIIDICASNNEDDELDKFMKEVEDQVMSENLVENLRNMNSDETI